MAQAAMPDLTWTQRPRILHLSADFPDSVSKDKTRVIQTLIDLTAQQFDHRVVSLNRISPHPVAFAGQWLAGVGKPRLRVKGEPFAYGEALTYCAPPKGLLHATMLHQLGETLARRHANTDTPDLVVGHKLTVEGIAAMRAATAMARPWAVTIQGDTDTKILDARPDLVPLLRRVFHGASSVWSFAPWSLAQVERRLGKRQGPTLMMPCPTDLDQPLPPKVEGRSLLSVFHLKSHKRKNLEALADALRHLAKDGCPVQLGLVGGGDTTETTAAHAAAGSAPGLTFEGPLDREAIRERMHDAIGFVLLSRRESFGLVFIEALFAGLPIVYPAGHSIDGYFDQCPFAIRVPLGDTAALARAMRRLVEEERSLKHHLARWLGSDEAERFRRPQIAAQFAQGLQLATGKMR